MDVRWTVMRRDRKQLDPAYNYQREYTVPEFLVSQSSSGRKPNVHVAPSVHGANRWLSRCHF